MKYILDTCVISETRKRQPNPQLLKWLKGTRQSDLYVSVITIGELRSGAHSAADADMRGRLEAWIDDCVVPAFNNRLVVFDFPVADQWGVLFGDGVAMGRTPSVCDSMIAATALAHGMALVTRNVSDFDFPGLEVINPFDTEKDSLLKTGGGCLALVTNCPGARHPGYERETMVRTEPWSCWDKLGIFLKVEYPTFKTFSSPRFHSNILNSNIQTLHPGRD